MSLYVGVDVGTQGTKTVVYDSSLKTVVASAAESYGLLDSNVPGRAEQDPSIWIEAVKSTVKRALERVDAKSVKAISVSGQQHGLVLLGAANEVLRPAKLWCDVEAADQAKVFSEACGFCYPPGFTGPKIMWVRDTEPQTFEKIKRVLLPHDYVNLYLTGKAAAECGDASGTALLDVESRRWDTEAAARIDPNLHKWLPPLVGPGEKIGAVLPAAAAATGLPEGVDVAPGGGDNMMSALGAGAVRDGVWVVSLGTSATLFGYSPRPILDPTGTVAPFCDCTGAWLPLLCIMNCTAVAEEARRASGLSHEEATREAAGVPAGCGGVNFLPYLSGERTPNWPHASGALLGLRPGGLASPGVVYRAALEGTAFALLAGMKRLQEFGCRVEELRVVGGGSRNELWCQIIADVFQVKVSRPSSGSESAALGAALQAAAVHSGRDVRQYVLDDGPGMAGEVLSPNPSNAQAYREAFERHVELGRRLFGQ
uniref:Xylulokinase n=1 Tax=Tetraselmis sp. GSL018 TaxID=582737 RepID=A0A061RC70_9CHLO